MLGSALLPFKDKDTIVLAIPGGGVPVGREIALILECTLDVIVTRKIGAPGDPEYAIGSVTQDGQTIADLKALQDMGISYDYLRDESARQLERIRRALKRFRGERPYPALEGRTVIISDDGIATGSTMKAAVESARKMKAMKVIVAVPVGPYDTIASLSTVVDRVVCLMTPVNFYAVGDYYGEFEHVGEEKVAEILDNMNKPVKAK